MFFFLVSHKLVPPALRALLDKQEGHIDGFILPGHVSVIIGEEPYRFLPEEYHIPSCIAGFDGLEILSAIANILEQRKTGNFVVGNTYHSVVMQKGNPVAQAMIKEVYDVCDDAWRGIGVIPNSGLRLKDAYAAYDVERALPIQLEKPSLDPKKGANVVVYCKGLLSQVNVHYLVKAVLLTTLLVLAWYL